MLPEGEQLLDPSLRRIAGDDGGIDCADGDAGDPMGHDAGLGQLLIDAGLIGAERAAALEHQHAFLGTLHRWFGGHSAAGRRPGGCPVAGRLGLGWLGHGPPLGYCMNQPWLTTRDWPVSALLGKLAKRRATSATS